MFLLLATHASASALTSCGAIPVDASCVRATEASDHLDLQIGCSGSSSPPGGPLSSVDLPPVSGPLTLSALGVVVAKASAPVRVCDGESVYRFDYRVAPSMYYRVESETLPLGMLVRVHPDTAVARRCFTNPVTCAPHAAKAPIEFAPWMRLHACVRGQPCGPARKALPGAEVLEWIRPACLARQKAACVWLDELEPDQGWSLLAGDWDNVAGVRVSKASQDLELGWDDVGPVLSTAPSNPVRHRSIDGKTTLEVRPDGVVVKRRKRVLWSWSGRGVRAASLRGDGKQLVLLFPGFAANLLLDDASALVPIEHAHVPAQPGGAVLSGLVLRSDGWPAAGLHVAARCEPGDEDFSCTAVTDLLGRFALALQAPGDHVVRLTGAHTKHLQAEAWGVVVPDLPIRVPAFVSPFDFEIDKDGTVIAAKEPLQVGDRLVSAGPVPFEAFGRDTDRSSMGGLRLPHAVILANGWGRVEVERGGERLSFPSRE